jgi:hypothetical protein
MVIGDEVEGEGDDVVGEVLATGDRELVGTDVGLLEGLREGGLVQTGKVLLLVLSQVP